ncbi:MAG: methyltransferase domain-containing protein, partial [Candidatus Omnitrophica bacterium]|nr:methyltransferase domain-containing protein [Candidatus Omnitrophota bacterium]
EKEVNEGKSFAPLRQVYSAMLMATWFKKTMKESLLGQVYADQSKVAGVALNDPAAKERIYQEYLEAYKVGVFNFVREDPDPLTQELIPRKYFSGGTQPYSAAQINEADAAEKLTPQQQKAAGKLREAGVDAVNVQLAAAGKSGNVLALHLQIPKMVKQVKGYLKNIKQSLEAVRERTAEESVRQLTWAPYVQMLEQMLGDIQSTQADAGACYAHLLNFQSRYQSLGVWLRWLSAKGEWNDAGDVFYQGLRLVTEMLSALKTSGSAGNPYDRLENVLRSFSYEDSIFDGEIKKTISVWAEEHPDTKTMSVMLVGAGAGEVVRGMKEWAYRQLGLALDVAVLNREKIRVNPKDYLKGLAAESQGAELPRLEAIESFVEEYDRIQKVYDVEGVALPFGDRHFDMVIVPSQVMPYILDKQKLLREVKRIIKPKARAFIADVGERSDDRWRDLVVPSLKDKMLRSGQYAWTSSSVNMIIKNERPASAFPVLIEDQVTPLFAPSLPMQFVVTYRAGRSSNHAQLAALDALQVDLTVAPRHVQQDTNPSAITEAAKGGIDLNDSLLAMTINRDGAGMPLPLARQDPAMMTMSGLIPNIIDITPAGDLPIFASITSL